MKPLLVKVEKIDFKKSKRNYIVERREYKAHPVASRQLTNMPFYRCQH
jgi:hypothetical protein